MERPSEKERAIREEGRRRAEETGGRRPTQRKAIPIAIAGAQCAALSVLSWRATTAAATFVVVDAAVGGDGVGGERSTPVPVRPRRRCERRSLRTLLPGVRFSPPRVPRFQSPPSTPFNSASDAIQLHPDVFPLRRSQERRGWRTPGAARCCCITSPSAAASRSRRCSS